MIKCLSVVNFLGNVFTFISGSFKSFGVITSLLFSNSDFQSTNFLVKFFFPVSFLEGVIDSKGQLNATLREKGTALGFQSEGHEDLEVSIQMLFRVILF